MHQAQRGVTAEGCTLRPTHYFHALLIVYRQSHHERFGHWNTVSNHRNGMFNTCITEGTAPDSAQGQPRLGLGKLVPIGARRERQDVLNSFNTVVF